MGISRCHAHRLAAVLLLALAVGVHAQGTDLPNLKAAPDASCEGRFAGVPLTDGWFKQSWSDTVVVFVHGIASDSKAAWLAGRSPCQFWPALVAGDTGNIGEPAVFLGGYYAGLDSSAAGIGDVAEQLFSSLAIPAGDPMVAPLDYKKIVFVTHSLGGVVVRRMLVDHAADFSSHQLSVLLYASPSNGSHYVGVISWLLSAYKYKLLEELKANSDTLADLNVRFRNFLVQRRREGSTTEVAEFFEARFPKFECDQTQWALSKIVFGLSCKLVVGFLPEIVPADMAGNFGSRPLRIPDTDHMTIVKPYRVQDETHRKLVLTLNDFNMAPARRNSVAALATVKVTGSLPAGSWVADTPPEDRLLLAGKFCNSDSAPTVRARCNADTLEVAKRETLEQGIRGFVVTRRDPQPAPDAGFRFEPEERPLMDRNSPEFEGKPVLRWLKVTAVPRPGADAAAGAVYTTTVQHLRYETRAEPWSLPELKVQRLGEDLIVRVPAAVSNARISEQGVSGASTGTLANLVSGSRLGMLVFRGKTTVGSEVHYRFETWSRRLGGTTSMWKEPAQ